MPVKKEDVIDLYFITGFLGAGKTTLLNNILNNVKNEKTGLIVNEFGEVNVDAEVLDYDDNTEIKEINNGSIFCSCLSGSFVKSILAYQDLPIDRLLVESSGLSNPSSLEQILDEVKNQSDNSFNYRGMIAVVDASNFLTVIQSAAAVMEQIMYSNLIIINKIDQVDSEIVAEVETKIREYNQDAEILRTSYGQAGAEIIKREYIKKLNLDLELNSKDLSCSVSPQIMFLELTEPISENELNDFLDYIGKQTYRMKGFISLQKGQVRVDSVGSEINIEAVENVNKTEGIVIFTEDQDQTEEKIYDYWDSKDVIKELR